MKRVQIRLFWIPFFKIFVKSIQFIIFTPWICICGIKFSFKDHRHTKELIQFYVWIGENFFIHFLRGRKISCSFFLGRNKSVQKNVKRLHINTIQMSMAELGNIVDIRGKKNISLWWLLQFLEYRTHLREYCPTDYGLRKILSDCKGCRKPYDSRRDFKNHACRSKGCLIFMVEQVRGQRQL